MNDIVVLKGEGEFKLVERRRVRHECNCGEPADERHSYLLPNARRNPQSSGYGRDDISWCSDHEVFTCAACRPRGHQPDVSGYEWCATFKLGNGRFDHMFLTWVETDVTAKVGALSLQQRGTES